MYQAPDYLDPVQPTPAEIEEQIKQAQKEAKKTKKTVNVEDFYKPRMITPDPVKFFSAQIHQKGFTL